MLYKLAANKDKKNDCDVKIRVNEITKKKVKSSYRTFVH